VKTITEKKTSLEQEFLIDVGEKSPCVFIFLDGDTGAALVQSLKVPAGIIRKVTAFNHDKETNFEDVWFRLKVDTQVIVPTRWGDNARAYLPLSNRILEIHINKPVFEESIIECELNAAPTSGAMIKLEFEEFPLERSMHKSAVKSKFTKKMELTV
jgi:hypothetical protein